MENITSAFEDVATDLYNLLIAEISGLQFLNKGSLIEINELAKMLLIKGAADLTRPQAERYLHQIIASTDGWVSDCQYHYVEDQNIWFRGANLQLINDSITDLEAWVAEWLIELIQADTDPVNSFLVNLDLAKWYAGEEGNEPGSYMAFVTLQPDDSFNVQLMQWATLINIKLDIQGAWLVTDNSLYACQAAVIGEEIDQALKK